MDGWNNYLEKIPILSCRHVYAELWQRLKFHSSSKNVTVKDSGVVFGGVRFNAICIQRLDVPDRSAYQQGILTKTVRKSAVGKCSILMSQFLSIQPQSGRGSCNNVPHCPVEHRDWESGDIKLWPSTVTSFIISLSDWHWKMAITPRA